MVEDDFFVGVRGDVFPVEFGVEFGGDGLGVFVVVEEVCEGDVFFGGVFRAELGEGVGAHYLRGGVGAVPGAEEDVVLVSGQWEPGVSGEDGCTSASGAQI